MPFCRKIVKITKFYVKQHLIFVLNPQHINNFIYFCNIQKHKIINKKKQRHYEKEIYLHRMWLHS